jgi:23S rRNA (guanosine2251-2'-O)-methyltransferase
MIKSSSNLNSIVVIAHDIRSSHNVGSLFRTCEGLGVDKLILSGYTPYPRADNDSRLPHITDKLEAQIDKTALGAQKSLEWEHVEDIKKITTSLKAEGYTILGLEQSDQSIAVNQFSPVPKMVLVLGNEVEGLDENVIKFCDQLLEIPMLGKKESFNVVQAAAMALFQLRFR